MKNFLNVSIIALTLCSVPSSWGQTALSITDPRPMAKAAELLGLKFGVPIDYEDPEYSYAGDVVDVTIAIARTAPSTQRTLIPRGGSLEVALAASSDVGAVLQTVLQHHNGTDNPGKFQLRQGNGRFEIVPTAVKRQDGRLGGEQPVLDVAITVPEQQWSGSELVGFICQALSQATGKTVVVGMVPTNLLNQTAVTLQADGEPARDVLLRAFAGLQYQQPVSTNVPQLSWQLFYGPDVKTYALNIRAVMAENPAPFGGTATQVLNRQ
jgi:hypothetical protein